MMTTASKPPKREEGSRKAALQPPKPQEPPLRCPRCDSTNTKFCYYNNYSLSQPRHFCKKCRRYWTRGGALRNVPVGGGTRKNKRLLKSTSASSTVSDSYKLYSSDISGGFKFSPGLASHDLGGFPLNRVMNPSSATGLAISSGGFSGSMIPENDTLEGSMNIDANLASSIESLSSLNQDLHRKLQHQRLAMLFGERFDQHKETAGNGDCLVMFQNPETVPPTETALAPEIVASTTTEWFFGNPGFLLQSSSSSTSSSAVCGGSAMGVSGSVENNGNGDGNMGNWHGFHLHHFNSDLP